MTSLARLSLELSALIQQEGMTKASQKAIIVSLLIAPGSRCTTRSRDLTEHLSCDPLRILTCSCPSHPPQDREDTKESNKDSNASGFAQQIPVDFRNKTEEVCR